MPKKDTRSPNEDPDRGYEIGYGRPPKHSQFRSGQSGNPSGRRKGVRNLATDVKRILGAPIKVRENGRVRTRSTQEAALKVLLEKALRGDLRALVRLLDLAFRFNNAGDTMPTEALGPEDQAILDDYLAAVAGTGVTPPVPTDADPENPSDDDPEQKGKK